MFHMTTFLINLPLITLPLFLLNFVTSWKVSIFGVFWPIFSRIRTESERYSVSLFIQSEYEKIQTRKTPNTDAFYALSLIALIKSLSMLPTRKDCVYVSFKRNNILRKPININSSKFINSLKLECLRCNVQLVHNRKSNNLR